MDRAVDRLLAEMKNPSMEKIRMQLASLETSAEWDRGLPYANNLQVYTRRNPDAPDIIPALLELVRISGKFDDIWMTRGAFWQAMQAAPDSISKRTVQQVYAETILEKADPELAREAIVPLLLDAYGYAHETRLVQNLATLLALKGDRQGAKQMYDYILRMHFFSENQLRFRSYEIFLDNLDRVGESFPTGEGILHAGGTGDQNPDRLIITAGQPAFIHFWTRRSSLEHDVSFLRELQTEFHGLALVSINVGEEAEAVDSFVEKYAPDWPQYRDPVGDFATQMGITFAGLYVHEPKGILIDCDGVIAAMPGREGAIRLALKAMQDPEDRPFRGGVGPRRVPEEAKNLQEIREPYLRDMVILEDQLDRFAFDRFRDLITLSSSRQEAASAALAALDRAARLTDAAAAQEIVQLYEEHFPGEGTPEIYLDRAIAFAHARAMLTEGDPEQAARRVFSAIGERHERDDLYLLLDLSTALQVKGDLEGARKAYEKIIEITDGAGEETWRTYIQALNLIGTRFEHFRGPGVARDVVDSRDFDGRTFLVDLWGTWCHACIREMPNVQRARLRFGSLGFSVVGIDVRDTRPKAAAFSMRTGYDWPSLFDTEEEIASNYVIVGYPTTILVDRNGRIRCIRAYGGGLEIGLALLLEEGQGTLSNRGH
jgi:thiol-disulfide isomerase/thioredoxin